MTDEEYQALIEQSFALGEMTKTDGWAVFVDYVQAVLTAPVAARLLGGSSKDYHADAGQYKALRRVVGIPDEVAKKLADERGRRLEREEPLT